MSNDGSTPGDGSTSPFGNHQGATMASGPSTGAHNFNADPQSSAPATGGRNFSAEKYSQEARDQEDIAGSIPAGGTLPYPAADPPAAEDISGIAGKGSVPFKNLRG